MPRELDPRRIEVLDPLVVAALKRMTPRQRVAATFRSRRTARQIQRAAIRRRRPGICDEELEREISRRLMRGAG
jgi:hypothetical protein